MKIKDISGFLEKIAPLSLQESYDNSGLLVGDNNAEVKGVLLTLDCTEAVVQEAMDRGCNLIVAHHPIIFGGLKSITGENYIERTIIKALKNDIGIYAAHTNFDNVSSGVNRKISEKIGLKNTEVLSPKRGILKKLVTFCPTAESGKVREALFKAGAGNIGEYDSCSYNLHGFGTFRAGEGTNPFVGKKGEVHEEKEQRIETIFPLHNLNKILSALFEAHPYEEVAYDIYPLDNKYTEVGSGMLGSLDEPMNPIDFLKKLKGDMKTGCIRYTDANIKKKIKKVAVCGGAGSFLLDKAISAGADVFITGDFKYHQFFDAEDKLIIADIGHYESEQFTSELFYELLTENFNTFAIRLSEVNTNPINYL